MIVRMTEKGDLSQFVASEVLGSTRRVKSEQVIEQAPCQDLVY